MTQESQPTIFENINIKYIWGPHGKSYVESTYRDLQKVYI